MFLAVTFITAKTFCVICPEKTVKRLTIMVVAIIILLLLILIIIIIKNNNNDKNNSAHDFLAG